MSAKTMMLVAVALALWAACCSAVALDCSVTTCPTGYGCCDLRGEDNVLVGNCYNTTTHFCSTEARITCAIQDGNGEVCVYTDGNTDINYPWGACIDSRYYKCCDNGYALKNTETCCNTTGCSSLNQVCVTVNALFKEWDPVYGLVDYTTPTYYTGDPNSLLGSSYRAVEYSRKACTSSSAYGKTNGRLIFGAAVPLLFAVGAIIALLYAFILFFVVDSARALNYLTLIWGVLAVGFSFLLIFSPIWHFGVLVAMVVGCALAVGREPTSFALRFVFVVNFLMSFLLLNASFAFFGSGSGPIEFLKTYVAGAEHLGSADCPSWYLGLFQYDTSIRSPYLYNNDDDHWGICNKGWLEALVIFTCVFIDFHVFLVITLAARIQRHSSEDRVTTTKISAVN